MARGSPKTVAASTNVTLCCLRLSVAFARSHSNRTLEPSMRPRSTQATADQVTASRVPPQAARRSYLRYRRAAAEEAGGEQLLVHRLDAAQRGRLRHHRPNLALADQ